MNTANLYLGSRKIHRIFAIIIIALIIVMAFTGLAMKYSFSFVDDGAMRYIHNQLSVVFTAVLAIMALTGLVMFIQPWLARRRAQTLQTKQN